MVTGTSWKKRNVTKFKKVEKGISARWRISFAMDGKVRVRVRIDRSWRGRNELGASEIGLVDAFVYGSLDKPFHTGNLALFYYFNKLRGV